MRPCKPGLLLLMRIISVQAVVTVCTVSFSASAQAPSGAVVNERSALFGECRFGYWSGTRNLDNTTDVGKLTCLAQWRKSISEDLRVSASARIGAADALDRATGQADRITGRVREAYVEYEKDLVRVRAGQQIIAWGRADRINPTDNLSPSDFTLLSQEDDEQRQGIAALSLQTKFDGYWSANVIYVPRFTPHIVPVGLLPRSTAFENRPNQPEYAFKLDRTSGNLDFSVSYYDGFDRYARYRIDPQDTTFPLPPPVIVPRFRAGFDKQQTFGADIAFSLGAFGVRSEGATSRYSSANSPTRRVDRWVLGVDRDFLETANINLQFFAIHRVDDGRAFLNANSAPALAAALDRLNTEFRSSERGMSLRVSNKFFNEQLRAELGAIYDVTFRGYVLRPRAIYSLSDKFKISAGADYFSGRQQSYFGALKRNDVVYAEFVWVF
jgi:hypothetical protein